MCGRICVCICTCPCVSGNGAWASVYLCVHTACFSFFLEGRGILNPFLKECSVEFPAKIMECIISFEKDLLLYEMHAYHMKWGELSIIMSFLIMKIHIGINGASLIWWYKLGGKTNPQISSRIFLTQLNDFNDKPHLLDIHFWLVIACKSGFQRCNILSEITLVMVS